MGWTVKTSRRRNRLRHRPHLESLDDRCLLSTGLEGPLAHAMPALRDRPAGLVHADDARPFQGKGARLVLRHHGHAAAQGEQPAGTMTSSAGAAYDPIIGASRVQFDL